MKTGEVVEIQYEGKTIAHITSCNINIDNTDVSDWREVIKGNNKWSIGIEIIDWDEQWAVAYRARMYANYFKN